MQGKWFGERCMIFRVPAARHTTCRPNGANGADTERMYDCVVSCRRLHSMIRKVKVIEDHESTSHKTLNFEVRCQNLPTEVKFLKILKHLPGASGGKALSTMDSTPKEECAEEGTQVPVSKTAREGAQATSSQTPRKGTQQPSEDTVREGTQTPLNKTAQNG